MNQPPTGSAIFPGPHPVDRPQITVQDLTTHGVLARFDGDGLFQTGKDSRSISHNNTRHAGFALHAFLAYSQRTHLQHQDITTILALLLTDLMHLGDALDADFDTALAMASADHAHEVGSQE